MPGRKRPRHGRPTLKRTDTFVGRRRARNSMVSIPRNKLAFPQSMKTKLRFVQRVEFAPDSTAVIQSPFSANDLRDPYVPIGGLQPRGFDELMNIYETFTVHGSTISASFMYEGYDGPSTKAAAGNLVKNAGSDSSEPPALTPMVCGLHKGIDTLGAGSAEIQMEKDRTQWTFINGQTGHKTLRGKLRVSDFYGKQALTGSEGYTGTASTSPTEQVFWEIWCGRVSNDYPAETTKVVCFVTIEYDATFTQPKVLSAS